MNKRLYLQALFVDYDLCTLAKQYGFEGPSLGFYSENGDVRIYTSLQQWSAPEYCLALTYDQMESWLITKGLAINRRLYETSKEWVHEVARLPTGEVLYANCNADRIKGWNWAVKEAFIVLAKWQNK